LDEIDLLTEFREFNAGEVVEDYFSFEDGSEEEGVLVHEGFELFRSCGYDGGVETGFDFPRLYGDVGGCADDEEVVVAEGCCLPTCTRSE